MLCAFTATLSLQFVELLKYLWASLCRCCDRSCSSDKRRTKQVEQEEYEKVYIGPEFDLSVRYASAVSLVLLVLMYSAGMPVLYFCLPVFFGVCFALDRCPVSYTHLTLPTICSV
eukprot:TRINITY_DN5759_c0_g2_i1.p4 TRINITY_DN5759_c0_g2~~TRINITY_DN5759_c0_g2_i1.p4  ORF type:complete len:115 (-),score=16.17 TRINITY_DN5759_c0_g2_i1:31-375(-)